ncbi:MAG: GumC family protein [Chthoniobacterales bacterium]
MTANHDSSDRPSYRSGAAAFARLDTSDRPLLRRAAEPRVETVTLSKIGDFLELDFGRLFSWLRAGLFAAIVLAVIGALAGAAFGVLAKPLYTVTSDILIDPTSLQVVPNGLYADPSQVDGQLLTAESKMRILTSGNVLARVVDDLNLVKDVEFYDPNPGFGLGSFSLGGSTDGRLADPKLEAQAMLASRVRASADQKSYVTTLSVTAGTPAKAVQISGAIFHAFQAELAKAETDGANRTAAALNDRLNQLKTDVQSAEEAVESYKRANGLVSTDTGALVSTQTMTQLNGELVDARARVASAQAAYDALVAAGRSATTQGTEDSTALSALRANAGNLQQQLDSESRLFGPKHPTIVKLNAELEAVNAQLDEQIARITQAAKATLGQAKATLTALSTQSDSLKSGVFTDNDALVTLRQLERDATAKSTVYEAFLGRAKQITEQEQIDTSNVRVISSAVPPNGRSSPPRTVLLILLGAIAGFVVGMLLAVVVGIARDLRSPRRDRAAALA